MSLIIYIHSCPWKFKESSSLYIRHLRASISAMSPSIYQTRPVEVMAPASSQPSESVNNNSKRNHI